MQTLYTVIDEVYDFSVGAFIRWVVVFFKRENAAYETILTLAPPKNEGMGSNVEVESDKAEEPLRFRSIDRILDERQIAVAQPAILPRNTVMYVGSVRAPLYVNPTEEFDSILLTVSYGQMVMVLDHKGRWSKVVVSDKEGWMLKDDLVDRAAHVYPEFVIGLKNEADDANTIRVRALIEDSFGGERIEYPLQAGEYVTYRLSRKGITIPWPPTRPRLPGRWHTLLKGVLGIHIGISPKTGAVMEYVLPQGVGHVAYVEAVFPDETINISEANYPDDGIYNERVLTRAEWQELKPVFIQILG